MIEKYDATIAGAESLWWSDNCASNRLKMFRAYLGQRSLLSIYRITCCNRMLLRGYQSLTGVTNLTKVARSYPLVHQFKESFSVMIPIFLDHSVMIYAKLAIIDQIADCLGSAIVRQERRLVCKLRLVGLVQPTSL